MRAPLWGLALVALVVALTVLRRQPPGAVPENAPSGQFSAARALKVAGSLLREGVPHPVGTPENTRVRERIVAELERLGLAPQVQTRMVCRSRGVCARVRNVLARIDGEVDGSAVMLASHYDSVDAGPGAGDDAQGVAVTLEIARALTEDGAHLRHPVILLIDEGEEVGLMGAQAFVDAHPWAKEVAVVVNLEARGTGGLSTMFETSDGNADLIAALARSVPRPTANSMAYEVYKHMPNDTDLTVFKEAGMYGLNFAFSREVAHYHTPLDSLENLDPGSVQHQGESVLAVVQELARRDLTLLSGEEAVYADILGFALVRWPAEMTLYIALGLLAALLAFALWSIRSENTRASGIVWGTAAFIVAIGVSAATVGGLAAAVSAAQGQTTPAYATPIWFRIATWSGAICLGFATASLLGRRAGAGGLWFGTWMWWAVAGVGVSAAVPGFGPMFMLPTAVALLGFGVALIHRRVRTLGLLLGVAGAGALWAPVVFALEDTFGWSLPLAVGAPLAVMLTTAAPALATGPAGARLRRLPLLLLGVVAAAAAAGASIGSLAPYHSALRPQRLTIVHYEDAAQEVAQLVVAPDLSEPVAAAAQFEAQPRVALPWSSAPMWVAPATPSGAPPPEFDVRQSSAIEDQRWRVRGHLLSARGANRAVLLVPVEGRLRELLVDGIPIDPAECLRQGHHRVFFFGFPAEGVDIELVFAAASPPAIQIIDCDAELPEDAATLADARGELGVPSQWGDSRCIEQRVELQAVQLGS